MGPSLSSWAFEQVCASVSSPLSGATAEHPHPPGHCEGIRCGPGKVLKTGPAIWYTQMCTAGAHRELGAFAQVAQLSRGWASYAEASLGEGKHDKAWVSWRNEGGGVIRWQWGLAFLNSSRPPGGMKPPLSSLGLRERRPSILPEAGEAVKKAPPNTHTTHTCTQLMCGMSLPWGREGIWGTHTEARHTWPRANMKTSHQRGSWWVGVIKQRVPLLGGLKRISVKEPEGQAAW